MYFFNESIQDELLRGAERDPINLDVECFSLFIQDYLEWFNIS